MRVRAAPPCDERLSNVSTSRDVHRRLRERRPSMRSSLRRQFLFLRAYVIATSLLLVIVATAAFRQGPKSQNLGEITVERINVVDAAGTLRLVISNKDRMHPGVMD